MNVYVMQTRMAKYSLEMYTADKVNQLKNAGIFPDLTSSVKMNDSASSNLCYYPKRLPLQQADRVTTEGKEEEVPCWVSRM